MASLSLDCEFFGAGLALENRNRPLNPGNVSGRRFISTTSGATHAIDEAQPIVFTFSVPVLEFGLTTLDLMENSDVADAFLTLEALNADGEVVATHTRTGRQGASGLDLDWLVSSDSGEITQARLLSNLSSRFGGYGIDDLLVTIPLPAAVWPFGSSLLMLLGISTTRRGMFWRRLT